MIRRIHGVRRISIKEAREVLGIQDTGELTKSELKKLYKEKAKLYHPDTFGSNVCCPCLTFVGKVQATVGGIRKVVVSKHSTS